MIKTQNLTPAIYYNRSRDFQLLGRIYDIIFNYMKTGADLINNAPLSDNFDSKLISLLATTLGFDQAHSYNIEELKALCSIFTIALKNKGNIQSINLVLNMLTNIYNSNSTCYAYVDESDPQKLMIFIPENITDTTIFEDVLTYILPAGMVCDVIHQEAVKTVMETIVEIGDDSIYINDNEPEQIQTGTVFAPLKENTEFEYKKFFGKLSNTTVLRVDTNATGDDGDIAKLNELKTEIQGLINNNSTNSGTGD